MNNKIKHLAMIYRDYLIYPEECYSENSAVKKIIREYHDDHYSKEISYFLKFHKYKKVRRGADLPFWGRKYFSNEPGQRIMVIAKDSLAEDAGSTVFYACLMDKLDEYQFSRFRKAQGIPPFKSWKRAKEFLLAIGDLDYMFITDARKVYRDKNNFDDEKSLELLNREIDFCNPDLVVLLGDATYNLFQFGIRYSTDVGMLPLIRNGIIFVPAPFPSFANATYNERIGSTLDLIKYMLSEEIQNTRRDFVNKMKDNIGK
ncbi:MAG: hypothetical protein HPY74_18270 [Firmicutes bacterium]|nr:hypothetical protein [Bacillota bacterium]